jgi:hypothetical protein
MSKLGLALKKMEDTIPDGIRWDRRWQGESEEESRDRTRRSRMEWMNKVKQVLMKGTTKEKKKYQYYEELIETGQQPRVLQQKAPVVKATMSVATLTEFPGNWRLHWEGELVSLWEERKSLGLLDWTRLIDCCKDSKKTATQEKYRFYIQLMKSGEHPTLHPDAVPSPEVGARLRTEGEIMNERVKANWMKFIRGGAERYRSKDREWR